MTCGPGRAQDNPPPPLPAVDLKGLTPEEARHLLAVLDDDVRRARLVQALRAIADGPAGVAPLPGGRTAAQGQSTGTTTEAGPIAPAGQAASARPVPTSQPSVRLDGNGLGAQVLAQLSARIRDLGSAMDRGVRSLTESARLLRQWALGLAENPAAFDRLGDIARRLAAVLACALAAEQLSMLVLRRPRAALARYAETRGGGVPGAKDASLEPSGAARRRVQLHRLGLALTRLAPALAGLIIDLIPVLVFAGVGNLLAGTSLADSGDGRLIILAVVNAYALCRGVMCAVRATVTSPDKGPSVLAVTPRTAAYVERWTRRIVATAVFGIAAADTALLLGLAPAAYDALLTVLALVDHLLVAVVILQCRRPVAAFILGPAKGQELVARLRQRLAHVWYLIALFLDLALFAVWAFRVPNGYTFLLRSLLITIVVMVGARLLAIGLLGGLDRLVGAETGRPEGVAGLRTRMAYYHATLRHLVSAVVIAMAAVALLQGWGVDVLPWFVRGALGGRLLSAVGTIVIAMLIAVVAWEASNIVVERRLARLALGQNYAGAARLRTIVPVLRGVMLATIVVVVGLTALSQLGVTIAPLLASAGIVGVAVGVGSQKLVQDFITGLFLLMENGMQVGEWVTAGGLSGTVETLTLRTVQLRGADGALHIIPYSSVSTVTNATRGTGNAAVNVSVAYKEDVDRVGAVLKEIAAEMRTEPRFAGMMRGDLELWGVDRIDGVMTTLTGQIVCTDAGRWPVQRELNRRIKIRFDELGIEIAVPTQRILLRHPSDDGAAGAGRPAPDPD